MKNLFTSLAVALAINMSAYSVDITINDGYGVGSGWYAATQENQEVEPGNVTGQVWDMEKFELDGNVLTMTGGFNFTNPGGYGGWRPGDLFIDVDGTGGYDFVAVIGGATSTYDVYNLVIANVEDVYYSQNALSTPWRYKNNGSLITSNESILYGSYSDVEGLHYTAELDLTWLTPYLSLDGATVTLHNTMECGNDNLIGQYFVGGDSYVTPVPESSNVLLVLGLGLGILITYKKSQV